MLSYMLDIESAINIDAKFNSNSSGWVLEHGLMMQAAWKPLIQTLSAAANGPKYQNHARCYFYNSLRAMYAAKPVVYAHSPSSIG